MGIGTIFAMLPVLFRLMHEAPHLVDDIEKFWNTVTDGVELPGHVQAGVQAAFVKLREGEVG